MTSRVVLLFLGPVLLGADGWPNPLRNSSFEEGNAGWNWAGDPSGAAVEVAAAHSGKKSIRLTGSTGKSVTGVHQAIVFDKPVARPLRFSGWSKALAIEATGGCVILLDGKYEDGSAMPRQVISFAHGTHGWQYGEASFEPVKPVKSLAIVALLAEAKGTAWFDDIELSLAPFAFRAVHTAAGMFGGPSLSVVADLTVAGAWKAELTGPAGVVAQASGGSPPLVADWANVPAGDYSLRLSAKEPGLDEITEETRSIKLPRGQARDYTAWIESSMKRVLPQALPASLPSPPQARISLAGNEYESFQICLRAAPGKQIKDVRLQVGDLVSASTGQRIPASQIEWQQVGFVKIARLRQPSRNGEAWAGWWPDPLLPVDKFDLKDGFTQPVWVTVHVPAGTPAGEYAGTVSLLANNEAPVTIRLQAKVYGFSLPVEGHLKTAFALMNGFLEHVYGKPLAPEIRRQFGDFLLKHRLNPDDISRTDLPDIDDLLRFNGRGLNAFNIANLVPERGNRTWVPNRELSDYTPEFMRRLIDRLDPFVAKLREVALIRKAYIYTFDERDSEFFPVMREYFGMVKLRYPEVRTMTTSHIPLDPKVLQDLHVDWIVPLTSQYNYDQAEACRRQGLQVWSYVAIGPREPYANFLADDPLVEARVLWWQAYQQKMDGLLYWGVNIWQRQNNDRPIDPSRRPFLDWSITTGKSNDEDELQELHGDGMLLYPGKDGPIGSIRLANIRDGLEDYEYLWMLGQKARGVEGARQACVPVTKSLTEFTQDPAAVYAQRDRIARLIF